MNEEGKEMNLAKAATRFSALKSADKVEVLALLAHQLTIVARENYEMGRGGLSNPVRMRAINEVQHRITAHLHALLQSNPERYPDTVLVRIVLEHPEDDVLRRQLSEAFGRAMLLSGAAA